MSEFIKIPGSVSNKAKLIPTGHLELKFNPRAGKVSIFAFVKKPGPPVIKGKPSADPDDPFGDFFEVEGLPVEVEVISPSGSRFKRFSVKDTTIKGIESIKPIGSFNVPENLAKKTWKCRFRSPKKIEVICSGSIRFIKKQHLVHESKIPLRVLNGAAREFLKGLGLQIKLDGGNSFIDFSSALKKHAGGALNKINFEVPGILKDINLISFSVRATTSGSGNRRGKVIEVEGRFEQEGKEIKIGPAEGNLFNLGFKIIFTLNKLSTSKKISYTAKVETGIFIERKFIQLVEAVALGILVGLGGLVLGVVGAVAGVLTFGLLKKKFDLKDLDKLLIKESENFLNNQGNRKKISAFLTDGIIQLVQRGHTLYQFKADEKNFIVKHFDAKIEERQIFILQTLPSIPNRPVTEAELKGVELLKKVDHIVFLMMENRSFDHLFGYLRLPVVMGGRNIKRVDGLEGKETNISGPTGSIGITEEKKNTIFVKSPGHTFADVAEQMNNGKMDGFLANFVKKFGKDEFLDIRGKVNPMAYYTGELLPVYDFFARNFLICDHWYSSHPGPTWPNRFCTLSGKTPELDNLEVTDPRLGYLTLKTVFDLLPKTDWKCFESDISFLRMYNKYRLEDESIVPVGEFFEMAKNGNLPLVSMIEPNYADFLPGDEFANDDHPPADLFRGQVLIEHIYNAIRKSPKWQKTMFIITYDEHGGFFDHFPPPGTLESSEKPVSKVHPDGPTFLGPRVPGIIISPWVGKNGFSTNVDHTIFEHTSFIKTVLLKKYGAPHPKMTERVEQANNLGILLTNVEPRLDIPELEPLIPPPSPLPGADPVDDGTVVGPKQDNRDFHEAMGKFGVPL